MGVETVKCQEFYMEVNEKMRGGGAERIATQEVNV